MLINLSFTSNQTHQETRKRQEEIAVGGGVAAGTGTIGKMMNRVQQTTKTANEATKLANEAAKTSKGLWASFKMNAKAYAVDIATRLKGLENVKIIGPIIKSPVTKYVSKFVGGAFAFFILATGITKMVNDGSRAVDDIKNRYHQYSEEA